MTGSSGDGASGTPQGGGGPWLGRVGCDDGLLFCDDFEDGDGAIRGPWTISESSTGTVSLDDGASASGRKSVKVKLGDAGGWGFLGINTSSLLTTTNRFYGRMHVLVPGGAVSGKAWAMVAGEGVYAGDTINIKFGGDGNALAAAYASSPRRSDCRSGSTGMLPTDEWVCVEWLLDGWNNVYEVWLNGEAMPTVHVEDGDTVPCSFNDLDGRLPVPNLRLLSVGWESTTSPGAQAIRIDDVAFHESRIGCPDPAP